MRDEREVLPPDAVLDAGAEAAVGRRRYRPAEEGAGVGRVDDNRLAPAKLPPESSRQRGIDLYGNNVPRVHDQLSSQDAGAGTDFEHKLIGIDARSSNQLLG